MNRNAFERPLAIHAPLKLTGDVVLLQCPGGLPLGSRVTFTLREEFFSGKIIQLSRTTDGQFHITVRLGSTSRNARKILEGEIQQGKEPTLPE